MIRDSGTSSAQTIRQVSGKSSAKHRVIEEAKKFYIIVGYLWVVLSLLELHRLAILRQLDRSDRIDYRIGLALINALVLGKVVVVADHLHLAENFLKEKTSGLSSRLSSGLLS
jgi:hypothetical protein